MWHGDDKLILPFVDDAEKVDVLGRKTMMVGIQTTNEEWDRCDDFTANNGGINWKHHTPNICIIHCDSVFANIYRLVESVNSGNPVLMPQIEDIVRAMDMHSSDNGYSGEDFIGCEFLLWDITDYHCDDEKDLYEFTLERVTTTH